MKRKLLLIVFFFLFLGHFSQAFAKLRVFNLDTRTPFLDLTPYQAIHKELKGKKIILQTEGFDGDISYSDSGRNEVVLWDGKSKSTGAWILVNLHNTSSDGIIRYFVVKNNPSSLKELIFPNTDIVVKKFLILGLDTINQINQEEGERYSVYKLNIGSYDTTIAVFHSSQTSPAPGIYVISPKKWRSITTTISAVETAILAISVIVLIYVISLWFIVPFQGIYIVIGLLVSFLLFILTNFGFLDHYLNLNANESLFFHIASASLFLSLISFTEIALYCYEKTNRKAKKLLTFIKCTSILYIFNILFALFFLKLAGLFLFVLTVFLIVINIFVIVIPSIDIKNTSSRLLLPSFILYTLSCIVIFINSIGMFDPFIGDCITNIFITISICVTVFVVVHKTRNSYARTIVEHIVENKSVSSNSDTHELDHYVCEGSMWLFSLNKKSVQLSKDALDILGVSQDSIKNTLDEEEWESFIFFQDKKLYKTIIQTALKSNKPFCFSFRIIDKTGHIKWITMNVRSHESNNNKLLVGLFYDVTNEYGSSQLLRETAYDRLTRAHTYAVFEFFIQNYKNEYKKGNTYKKDSDIVIVYINIEPLSENRVQKALGQGGQALLLMSIMRRLEKIVVLGKQEDTGNIFRFDFQGFVCAFYYTNKQDIKSITTMIMSCFDEQFTIKNISFTITPSLGVSELDKRTTLKASDFLKEAYLASFVAKKRKHPRIVVFQKDASINTSIKNHWEIEKEIKTGIEQKNFSLLYQPIFSCKIKSELCGFMISVQWDHPLHGLLFDQTFIPEIYSPLSDHFFDLTYYLLKKSLNEIASLQKLHEKFLLKRKKIFFSIPIFSPKWFDITKQDELVYILNKYDVVLDAIKLTVTESMFMRDSFFLTQIFEELKKIHISFGMHKFGSGMCNILSLRSSPFDTIGIGRNFFENEQNRKDKYGSFVDSIFHMLKLSGHNLLFQNLSSKEQFDYSIASNIDMAHGIFFHTPITFKELADSMESIAQPPEIKSSVNEIDV